METWFAERPVGEMRPGDHAWFAFANGEEQQEVIGTFVADGLKTAEKVVYVPDLAQAVPATPPLPRGVSGIDLQSCADRGQLRIIPPDQACLDRRGGFDPGLLMATLDREIAGAFDEGFRAVRISADMGWALREPGGSDRVLGCEHEFEQAFSASTMAMAICQVDRRACGPEELMALRDSHEVLVEVDPAFNDGVLKITRTFWPQGLRVEGDLDGARHSVFANTLATVMKSPGRIHLDFARLRFIDLGALKLLADHAMDRPGRDALVLENLPAEIENIIEMVGWHRLPGIQRGHGEAR